MFEVVYGSVQYFCVAKYFTVEPDKFEISNMTSSCSFEKHSVFKKNRTVKFSRPRQKETTHKECIYHLKSLWSLTICYPKVGRNHMMLLYNTK